jgi:hypothetical protein
LRGATRQMEIASGYATGIFYGDLVKRVTGGTIEKDTGTTTATPCGVFLGGVLLLVLPLVKCSFNSFTLLVSPLQRALRFLPMLLMILTRCSK